MLKKRIVVLFAALCLILSGCAEPQTDDPGAAAENRNPAAMEDLGAVEPVRKDETRTIFPLPDPAMENLTDAILSVSLEEGDAYVDENGRMQMDLKIYSYDQYDMVDIAQLKVGDTLVRHSGAVEVSSKEQNEEGTIFVGVTDRQIGGGDRADQVIHDPSDQIKDGMGQLTVVRGLPLDASVELLILSHRLIKSDPSLVAFA